MNRSLVSLTFLLVSLQVSAQMLDDTTKLVYGPTTSRFMYEADLMHNDTLYQSIDTSIYNLEYFEFKNTADRIYQDLGNNGTALNPVYYAIPRTIGGITGFESYTPYIKQAKEFKYYDTKSPFINLYLGLGGMNRNVVDFEFSRNINPQWNIGFDIYRISSNKLLGSRSQNDPQVTRSDVDFYVFHRSKNSKYHIMFHGYKSDHKVAESGGIKLVEGAPEKDKFLYRDSDIKLRNAYSNDDRTRSRLYHQYSIKPFFEIYNSIEKSTAENNYDDFPLLATTDYYDEYLISADSTMDASLFKELKIEAGVKGRVAKRIFYSAYLKRRNLKFNYSYIDVHNGEGENYIGGDLKIFVTKTNALIGSVEVLDGGQYYFKGAFENNFIKASYTSSKYRPAYLSERYFGNHYEWSNDFNDIFSNTIQGSIFFIFPFLKIEPEVEITAIDDYVYYGTDKKPTQNTDVIVINKYSAKADFSPGKHFHLDNKLIFNNVSGDGGNAIRTPNWNYFGKWYYENIVFNNYMEMQLGLNFHWQSEYFANAYDPITQQFYIQDDENIASYWTSDIFFVMKAKRLSVWLKYLYWNRPREGGYFVTPLYPGTKNSFDIGMRWHFYD